jgi:hypothetical protein
METSVIIENKDNTQNTSPFLPTVFSVISGILLWTLIEYSLHRWVFHMEPSGKSKAMIYVHFAIHGLHHKVCIDRFCMCVS